MCELKKQLQKICVKKIALFCDVDPEAVIESRDVDILYQIPLNLQKQNMDQIVCDQLNVTAPKADMGDWQEMVKHIGQLNKTIKISMLVSTQIYRMLIFQLTKHYAMQDIQLTQRLRLPI